MKKEHILQLIGIAIFLIVTSLTYGIVTPIRPTNSSLETLTSEITHPTTNTTTNSTTNTIVGTSPLTSYYHIMIAITAGIVITIVAMFLLISW